MMVPDFRVFLVGTRHLWRRAGLTGARTGAIEDPALAAKFITTDGLANKQLAIWFGKPLISQSDTVAPRVVVVTHKNPKQLRAEVASREIHRKEALELYAIDETLIAALADRLEKNTAWALTFNDGQIYVEVGGASLIGSMEKLSPSD